MTNAKANKPNQANDNSRRQNGKEKPAAKLERFAQMRRRKVVLPPYKDLRKDYPPGTPKDKVIRDAYREAIAELVQSHSLGAVTEIVLRDGRIIRNPDPLAAYKDAATISGWDLTMEADE